MFHRIGAAAYKANLDNINSLTEILNHPERKFNSIHIAGTNGKGSVSHMLASIFQESGYKTGLFTSPHLKDFRERIRVNGKMIVKKSVTEFIEKHKLAFDKIQPSFFEWTSALAFEYFAEEKVDIAIIETGLGGRLDSTNVISPLLSVITNISFDHMNLLGDTLKVIAAEKAGIIKPSIEVVVGERQKETEEIFSDRAAVSNSHLLFASDHYRADIINTMVEGQELNIYKDDRLKFEKILVDLGGNYQKKNVCTVLQSIELISGYFKKINQLTIVNGLRKVRKNTGLRGRWEVISNSPRTIADVAHNEGGIKYIVEQLQTMNYRKLHIVIGIVNDKDSSSILSLLPKNAEYYFCNASLPRALKADELKKVASGFKLNGNSYATVKDALQAAQKKAGVEDLIFVGGSTFVVAEIL
jgi:dihydrofolate synthase/folylpolyglutamate synthase